MRHPGKLVGPRDISWPSALRRAFREFLLLPSLIVAGFIVLAVVTDALDRSSWHWVAVAHAQIGTYVFGKPSGTSTVLSTISGGVITMTSITVSVLLIALQQSSSNLTPQVFDQFLRHRQNQLFFGYFVGLAVYSLMILASIDAPFNPTFGAAGTLLATLMALLILIAMLYSIVTQMRPVNIIASIHDHVLRARAPWSEVVARTRRSSLHHGIPCGIRVEDNGFVVDIDIDKLAEVATERRGELELRVSLGTFVSAGDTIASWRGAIGLPDEAVAQVRRAIAVQSRREITSDPSYGIEQLETIGWTAISSAKQNQSAGLLCVQQLRDILARWAQTGELDIEHVQHDRQLPIVYVDDCPDRLFDALEALAIVSSESLQQQCFAEVLVAFARVYEVLPAEARRRVDDTLLRLLSAMGDHVMSHTLERSLERIEQALSAAGARSVVAAVQQARRDLGSSIGTLGSRDTRVPEHHGRA